MQIDWNADAWASVYYLASLLRGDDQEATAPIAQTIAARLAAFERALRASTGSPERAWRLLPVLAVSNRDPKPLAERLLVRLEGRAAATPAAVGRLAAEFSELWGCVLDAAPQFEQRIAHRIRPIREAWDAVGPGVLRQMAILTDERLFTDRAQVVIVEPLNGGGEPYLDQNTVLLEGVLANPFPQLPETLRLAWHLSQLNNDLAAYSDQIEPRRLPFVSKLAMIPPTLAAAAELGLASDDAATREFAIGEWLARGENLTGLDAAASSVQAWWETLRASPAPWPIALTGLDRLLQL